MAEKNIDPSSDAVTKNLKSFVTFMLVTGDECIFNSKYSMEFS